MQVSIGITVFTVILILVIISRSETINKSVTVFRRKTKIMDL